MDYKRMAFYQIYPRSYCDSNGDGIGDIKGIISKLDYIASLGVDGIWFSPLYASPNADFGYDISDYRAINSQYGTMEDFDLLLKEMHARNLKCIMDLVINHTSSEHNWFKQSCSSTSNPYRDYYIWRKGRGKDGKKPPNNWTSFFLGSAWEYHQPTDQWYLHLFDKNQPDLNYANPKVKQEIKDMLKFWLDKGVDGFRCDVITLLCKTPGLPDGKGKIALVGKEHYKDNKGMKELLLELRKDVFDKYDTFTVGESVLIDTKTALEYIDERHQSLNTLFAFDHMNADCHLGIKQFPKKFNLMQLKQANQRWQNDLYNKGWNANYLENHDQARIVGRYCTSDAQYRIYGAKMLANCYMFLSGTPFIYQGQEIGMTSIKMKNITDYQDVETVRSYNLLKKFIGKRAAMKKLCLLSRDNARTPMQWNDGAQAGFSDNANTWLPLNPNYKQINVSSQLEDEDSILNYYKKLISLRKQRDEMVFGTYKLLNIGGKKLYAYLREYQGKRLLVINNFTTKNYSFTPPENVHYSNSELLIGNYTNSPKKLEKFVLRPYESLVFSLFD